MFKDFKDDVDFARLLRAEESVAVLPGTIFKSPRFVRLVITPPMDKLKEACDRLEEFCNRHKLE
jgi:tyrosine aminotransferase